MEKSALMSVMPETSQSAMRQYFFSAEVSFLTNSLTAVLSVALLVNRQGLGGGGGGGGGGGDGGKGGGGDGGGSDGGGDM